MKNPPPLNDVLERLRDVDANTPWSELVDVLVDASAEIERLREAAPQPPDPQTEGEWRAYRRGKVDGYSEGVIAGWDEARRRFEALATEPDEIKKHRDAVQRRAGP